MSRAPYFNEWEQPTQAHLQQRSRTKAAIFLWITGGMLVLTMGCCSASYSALAMMPLRFLDPANPQHAELLRQIGPMRNLWYGIAAIALLGLIPGFAYLALAFGVRQGRQVQTTICQTLLLLQCILLAGMLAMALLGAAMQRDILSAIMVLVTLGSLLALLIYTLTLLMGLRDADSTPQHDEIVDRDPWR